MRILTVGSMYPPHSTGGYELVWEGTVDHLRRAGHEVTVLASDYARPGRGPDPGHVRRELRWYWRDHRWPRMGPLERMRLERHNAAVLERALDELRPDVVSWWAMGGMSLSLIQQVARAGIPAAAIVCDDWLIYGPKVDGWLRMARWIPAGRALERLTGIPTRVGLDSRIRWLFASDMLRSRAQAHGVDVAGAVVSHRGIDTELFRPGPGKEWGWRLLYVGRIDRRKGIDLAVRALAGLPPDATLRVIGAGDEEYAAELRGLVGAEGLEGRVTFGVAEYEELPALYAGADAVVFPVRWDEPWGLVPQEAMASGIPVIATGRGGSGEYLRDGVNCVLFDPDAGPGALARAVEAVASDPGMRGRLRAGGLETASRLTVGRWDSDIERLHADAISAFERDAPHGGR